MRGVSSPGGAEGSSRHTGRRPGLLARGSSPAMPKPNEVRPDDFYMQFAPDPAAGKTVHLANDIILAPGGMQELLRKQKKRQLTGGMGDQTLEETLLEVLCEVETNGCPLAKWLREQNGWAPLDVSGIKREMRRQVEAVQLESALRQDHAIITAILQAQKRGAHHPSSRSPLAGAALTRSGWSAVPLAAYVEMQAMQARDRLLAGDEGGAAAAGGQGSERLDNWEVRARRSFPALAGNLCRSDLTAASVRLVPFWNKRLPMRLMRSDMCAASNAACLRRRVRLTPGRGVAQEAAKSFQQQAQLKRQIGNIDVKHRTRRQIKLIMSLDHLPGEVGCRRQVIGLSAGQRECHGRTRQKSPFQRCSDSAGIQHIVAKVGAEVDSCHHHVNAVFIQRIEAQMHAVGRGSVDTDKAVFQGERP